MVGNLHGNSMSIKDFPIQERPREKASMYGLNALTNAELLAILISTGTKEKDALQLAYELLASFGGVNGIIQATSSELKKIKGISYAKALRILSGIVLYERALLEKACHNLNIKGKDAIGNFFVSKIGSSNQEVGYVVIVDSKNKVLHFRELFRGTCSSFSADPMLILRLVIGEGNRFYFIHNHPSGCLVPSDKDINFTTQLDVCSMTMGMELVDHLIVNESSFISVFDYMSKINKV